MQKRRKFLENVLKSRKQRLVAVKKGKIFKVLRYFVHFIIIFHFLFVFCHFLAISHFVPCDMGPHLHEWDFSIPPLPKYHWGIQYVMEVRYQHHNQLVAEQATINVL